ncbi:hypothetical protein E2C01_091063 [Portunus trituberculatus]|uniref:Uncharacterized protein n=1 Tax=Portunus trituberculatus TaxID=210409 RepID=A0A5B7JMK1_PORTR|nr:hypothetical protein [Portunus trituberculatus]
MVPLYHGGPRGAIQPYSLTHLTCTCNIVNTLHTSLSLDTASHWANCTFNPTTSGRMEPEST